MSAEPAGPVEPIAIVGAARPLDFAMPPDGYPFVTEQRRASVWRKVPSSGLQSPIFTREPVPVLVGMATVCPAIQLAEGQVVQA